VTDPGRNAVHLEYEIGTPALPADVPVHGVSIELARISYNTHPTLGEHCFKNEIALTYDTVVGSSFSPPPYLVSMLGDVALARQRILLSIDVMSRLGCDAHAEPPQRLRRYAFSYRPDADTRQPRLGAVQMFGRQGTPEETSGVLIAYYA